MNVDKGRYEMPSIEHHPHLMCLDHATLAERRTRHRHYHGDKTLTNLYYLKQTSQQIRGKYTMLV